MEILIWEVRNEKGMTIRQLAELSGVPRSTINDLESRHADFRMTQFELLAKALGVGIVDLFDSEYKYNKFVRDSGQICENEDK